MTDYGSADEVLILERALEGGLLDEAYAFWDGPHAGPKDAEALATFWRLAFERTDSLGVPRALVNEVARTRGLRKWRTR